MAEAPLLSSDEETELGLKIQQLREWEGVRDEQNEHLGREPTIAEWMQGVNYNGSSAEFQAAVMDFRHAKGVMVNSNMRLVVSIARRYQNLGVNLQDLIQEGSLGLIRAAEKYDPSRGFRFSTYASWWIQQSVFRSIAFHSRIIRLPMHVHNLLNRVRNTRKDMFMETGRIPSDEELATRLRVPLEKLRLVMRSSRRTYSSNAPMKARKRKGSAASGAPAEIELNYEDQNDSDGELPEEFVENMMFRNDIYETLDVLEDDERYVVSLRYGLGSAKRMTVSQIAELADSSKSWVKRTEARALRKLRRPHYQFKLQSYSEHHGGRKVKTKASERALPPIPGTPGTTLARPGPSSKEQEGEGLKGPRPLRSRMSSVASSEAASAAMRARKAYSATSGSGTIPGVSSLRPGVPANQEEQIRAFNRLLEDGFL